MTMTPTQREAALRLADWLHASGVVNSEVKETIALLRELLAEPQVGDDVAWLWTHCKALGMKRKSLSGSRRDDIALYVVDLHDLRAEPQSEPVARIRVWWKPSHDGTMQCHAELTDFENCIDQLPEGEHLLYTHPPQQRKPLTRNEIDAIWNGMGSFTDRDADGCNSPAQTLAAIARHREALRDLANAADAVGVRYFDSDDPSDEVQAMQAATINAREVLRA